MENGAGPIFSVGNFSRIGWQFIEKEDVKSKFQH
jgi:hypothetical protein